ncbi:GAF and ANTAR domain-containing protein [Actinokineospora iranica]|uniref:ANTAR domain-containing protein n=1 Tax=Actinokineospora iranica TaxID=1271860 RepID=A0A1G6S6M4_9PSEU|nr:GAF and ANTAR domain-containing protein [Actinokineospora iranica]SDD12489.1 ANTAR domain-containing protein [Actinokineospora iranica]
MVRPTTSRLTRVFGWIADKAIERDEPVSVGVLCQTAVARLDVHGAVLTMDTSGWPEVRDATDALGERLTELQVTVGEGPAVDVWHGDGPALVADLDAPSSQARWPMFAPLAVEAGAAALFALPLCVGAIRVGVLSLHRTETGHLDAAALTDSLAFAELALRLLLDEQAGRDTADSIADDVLSLHHPQVHQATGMVAAQLDVSMADAFAHLRARSFVEQTPLSGLAADVVTRRRRFDRDEERP